MTTVRSLALLAITITFGLPARAQDPAAEPAAPETHAAQAEGYHVAKKLDLGGPGRWDYLVADGDAHRLYVTRSTRVTVLDTQTGKPIGEVADTPGVHGVALVKDLGLGFASNGKDASVTVFDLASFKPVEKVKTGEGPDAITFDPASRQVFAFNGRGHSATAIAAAAKDGTPRATRSVDLGGKPESGVADGMGHVFVNIEDKNEVVDIDAKTMTVAHRWPTAPGEEPTGMSMDPKSRRLFVSCGNQMMVVLDADSGKVVATPAIGKGTDACAFEASTRLAFSSNGEGTLTVVHEDAADKFSVVATVPTQRGARTMAIDPKTHDIFLATTEPDEAKTFVILVLHQGE